MHLPVQAKPFTPTDTATVIAHWPTDVNREHRQTTVNNTDPASAATQANRYLSQAIRPGESRLYGMAQASLQPLISSATTNLDVWLAWAQIQQHQHNFSAAQRALVQVINIDPHNISANLLAARIHLIQGDHQQARQSCLKLLGYSDLLTASACVLEVTSQTPDKLAQSYEQLQQLIKREGLPNDERGPWIAQLLADMAMRLGDNTSAAQWLQPQLSNASVSLLAQWAQTQLAQGNYQQLLDYLAPILDSAKEADDTLLLPLAIAEKSTSTATKWQSLLNERVALREQRQDKQHANELARYFLELNPQPQKALYWAQAHYESSHEASDKQLLERAQTAAGKTRQEAL